MLRATVQFSKQKTRNCYVVVTESSVVIASAETNDKARHSLLDCTA